MSASLWYVVLISLGIGMAVPALWIVLLATGQIPELKARRRDILFHIAAEAATGSCLLASGAAVLVAHDKQWSRLLSTFALGMLVYTLVQSPGYYVDRRNSAMLAMFGIVWALTVPAVVLRFASS